jgi:hypothetical protein
MKSVIINRIVKSSPQIYVPLMWLRRTPFREKICRPDTDLLIEGYESSGNSWLFAGFESLHPELRIAHHLHKVAQLKLARRYRTTGVILFRDPSQAIASRIAAFNCNLNIGVSEYLDFYNFALENVDLFSVYDFADVTADLGRVVNSIEERLGILVSDIKKDVFEPRVREIMQNRSQKHGRISRLPDGQRSQHRRELVPAVHNHRDWPRLASLHEALRDARVVL